MDITNCLKRYITRLDDNGKPTRNIANFGLYPLEKAKVMRNGEYFGVEIQAIDYIQPLFTTHNIIKAYDLLQKEEYSDIIQILKIKQEYEKYGNDVVHYIIAKWCDVTHIECPKKVKSNINIKDETLDKRIKSNRSDEIIGKFKIISIGANTNTGSEVVPEEWIGKEFGSGKELHAEMNKLSYRKGCPPVTYCCTYGMGITTDSDIKQWSKFDKKIASQFDYFLILDKTKEGVKTRIVNKVPLLRPPASELIPRVPDKNSDYLMIFLPKSIKCIKMVILVGNGIFVKDKNRSLIVKSNTSYLSSLLQKCFRNQTVCHLLDETIGKLHYSSGYNLPDQHYARVSGCRQLCWRSFISLVEDVSPYTCSDVSIDVLDLFALAYICHIDPDVFLSEYVLTQLKKSMVSAQSLPVCWDWRKGQDKFTNIKYEHIVSHIDLNKKNNSNRITNSFLLALVLMPMMKNDFVMLSKAYDFTFKYKVPVLPTYLINNDMLNDPDVNNEVKMCAMDMHCMPSILIQLQGSLAIMPSEKYSLPNLSSFIWQNSSGLNTRYDSKPKNIKTSDDLIVLRTLYDIQSASIKTEVFESKFGWIENSVGSNNTNKIDNTNNACPVNISRLAFLLIFGKKYKLNKKIENKQYDVIICGSVDKPCKVKKSIDKNKMEYVDEKSRYLAEKEFVLSFNETINFKYVSPPIGYKWIDPIKTLNLKLNIKIIKDNPTTFSHNLAFYVDNIKLEPFDGAKLIEKIKTQTIYDDIPDNFEDMLNTVFFNQVDDVFDTLIELFKVAKERRNMSDNRIFNWSKLINKDNLRSILSYVRSRIIMAKGELQIGPVDRRGHRTQNGISYLCEGVIWRFIIALSALYPNVIISTTPYKFRINMAEYGYLHLLNCLDNLTKVEKLQNNNFNEIKIVSKLWSHQEKTANKIISNMFDYNLRGFGDASSVGSGKTLTALAIMDKILTKLDRTINTTINNTGFLILLPTDKLFDTWETEIEKHTKGFDIIKQQSDGSLNTRSTFDVKRNTIVGKDTIKQHSIVITTMGRCRDHPIVHPWLLTVIDECLTVQNKEALQTEEAWRQSSYSYFGILMLSATFFRSRFEKMLYMLSMLNTGLPETSEYLDTILSESIVCNLGEKQRKWIENVNENFLTKTQQKSYDEIALKYLEIGFEKVFHMLAKFIYDNVDYVKIFEQTINKITKLRPKSKILIYATSKAEADLVAKIKTVGRYPDITKTHVVLSYAEGTYGLNNLVIFDTILTRPPEPDKLPQMKGRLDRPNQNSDILHIEYVLIKNTIEDACLYKLEIANNFYGQHILPLAEYYKMAIVGKDLIENK